MKFESFPQKKEEDLKVDHEESTEQHKSALLRKLRNVFVAASTLAMTSPALAQKHKGTEKAREPIEVTDKNDKRLKAYEDSLSLHKMGNDYQRKTFLRNKESPYKEDEYRSYNKGDGWTKDVIKDEVNEEASWKTTDAEMLRMGHTKEDLEDLKTRRKIATLSNKSKILPVGYYPIEGYLPAFKKPVQPVIYKKPEIKKDTVHVEKVITEEKKVLEPTVIKKKEEIPTPQIHFKEFGALPLYDAQQHFIGQPVLLENGMVQLTDQNGKLIGKPAERGLVNQYGDTNTGNTKLEEVFGVGK